MAVHALARLGRLLADHRGNAQRVIGWAYISTLFLLLIFLVFGDRIFGAERTYVVTARTLSLDIDFASNAYPWSFAKATTCKKLPEPKRASTATQTGECAASQFVELAEAPVTLLWQVESKAQVRVTGAGDLEIWLLSDLGDLPAQSIVRVASDAWRDEGILPFFGRVRLGSPLASGSRDILLDGSYEARQTTLLSRLAPERETSVVLKGTLNRGDSVRIIDARESDVPMRTWGHLFASGDVEGALPSVQVVVISERGDPALSITYLGGKGPAVIRPDWMDNAISDPLFLAIAGLIAFLANALNLMVPILWPVRK